MIRDRLPGNQARGSLREQLRDYEIVLIMDALERVRGNQMDASRLLGIPLRTLVYKLKKYDIRARMRASEGDPDSMIA